MGAVIEGERFAFTHYRIDESDLGDYNELPYGSFRPDRSGAYVMPLVYSEYHGDLTDRANLEAFEEAFSGLQSIEWWALEGGYNTHAIVIQRDADERVPAIGEFVEALRGYPANMAAEARLQRLEMEQHDEQWDRYGRDELRRAVEHLYQNEVAIEPEDRVLRVRYLLQKLFPRLDPAFDELEDEVLIQLMRATGLDDEGDDLDSVWSEAMQHGRGDEERSENAESYRFDINAGIELFLTKVVGQQKFIVALDGLEDNGGEWFPAVGLVVRSVR